MKKHSLRNISVSRRLFYSYLLMSILPMVATALIAYQVANNAIIAKTGRSSSQLLLSLGVNITGVADQYGQFAYEIMALQETQQGLKFFDEWSSLKKNRFVYDYLRTEISARLSSVPDLREVLLINNEGTLVYSQGFLLFDQEAVERCIEQGGRGLNWLSVTVSGKNYVACVKPVPTTSGMYDIGHMVLLIDADAFYRCIRDIDLGTGATIFITDAEGGNVVSQNAAFARGQPVDEELRALCRERPSGEIIESYPFAGRDSMIVYTGLEKMGWFLTAAVPQDYLRSETEQIRTLLILLISVCLVGSMLVYHLIWKSITQPIDRLVQLVRRSADENFDRPADDGRDELGFLGRAYWQIVRRMRELIVQVEQEQRQKREYELKMLQAQINPHFLFNTLNSLRWAALMSRAPNVAQGLGALSDLLKNTIVDRNEFVTIGEELKNIENYVTIQRLRYGGIFTVEYRTDPGSESLYTLKFLLQPVVENSIIHGIDENSGDNRILITIRREGERLVMVIADNGKGFDPTVPRGQLAGKRLSGIGVDNVAQRVALHFGEGYGMRIESAVGAGTTATIEIPALTEPPGAAPEEERAPG